MTKETRIYSGEKTVSSINEAGQEEEDKSIQVLISYTEPLPNTISILVLICLLNVPFCDTEL